MTDPYRDTTELALSTGRRVRARIRTQTGTTRPACVLLHGNPGSLLDWEHLFEPLARLADVVAIDLPGFGRSARPGSDPSQLDLEHLARDAVAVGDLLSPDAPFFLIGHSHGGGVAQMAAARHPQRVAGIVPIGTLGFPAHRSYRVLCAPGAASLAVAAGALFRSRRMQPVLRTILRQILRDIFHPERASDDRVDKELAVLTARPAILRSMVDVTLGQPSRRLQRAARDVRCPALFIHGEQDALVPIRCARNAHEAIARSGGRSELIGVPHAGHMLVQYQAPRLAGEIERFLSRVAAGAHSQTQPG